MQQENSPHITVTGTTHKSVGLLFDMVIHGLVFMKQKHAVAVTVTCAAGLQKTFGCLHIRAGLQKKKLITGRSVYGAGSS